MHIHKLKWKRRLFAIPLALGAIFVFGLSAPGQADAQEAGQANLYSAQVERWRSLVARYFRPEDVDKALYVIQYESGGNPNAVNAQSGAAGLFQILPLHGVNGGDPETAARWAANRVYNVRGGWQDWGEGVLYRGRRFGALGLYPYTSVSGSLATRSTATTAAATPAAVSPRALRTAASSAGDRSDDGINGKRNCLQGRAPARTGGARTAH
jgi:hypothetical protein